MQALQTHLGRPVLSEPQRGFSVQGLNTPFQGESSFQTLLKKEVFMQEFKAREGPPERSLFSAVGMRSESQNAPHKTENTAYSQKAHEERSARDLTQTEKKDAAHDVSREKADETKASHSYAEAEKAASSADAGTEVTEDAAKTEAGKKADTVMSDDAAQAQLSEKNAFSFDAADEQSVVKPESLESGKVRYAKKAASENTEDEELSVNAEQNGTQELLSAQAAALVSFEQIDEVQTHKAHRTETAEFKADDAELENVFASDKLNRAAEEPGVNLAEIPAIKVHDERTKTAAAADKKQPLLSSVRYDGKGNAEADILLNPADGSKGEADPSVLAKGGNSSFTAEARESKQSNFASMLSSEIRNNAADLVKTGSMILRDGNKGTINLILHPEELGNVKIRLQISDNILTGRITVASEEAYKAFKANIASLTEAFTSSGFDTAGFDLSWSGGRESGTGGQQADSGHTAHNPLAFRYDEQNPVLDADEAEYRVLESRPYVNLIA